MDVSATVLRDAASSSPISSPPESAHGKDEVTYQDSDLLQAKTAFAQPQFQFDPQSNALSSETASAKPKHTNTIGGLSNTSSNPNPTEPATTRKKPGPKKKKEEGPNTGKGDGTKPPRQPRKPRDPDAPPRKRTKKNEEASVAISQPSKPLATNGALLPGSAPTGMSGYPAGGGSSEADKQHNLSNSSQQAIIQPQAVGQVQAQAQAQGPPPQQSRGQRFDPIRSASAENARLANSSPGPSKLQPSPTHARASNTIASLIEPPQSQAAPSAAQAAYVPRPQEGSTGSASPAKTETKVKELVPPSTGLAKIGNGVISAQDGSDTDKLAHPTTNGKSGASSRAQSPKPARKKKEPPQIPPGNGLLSNGAFGKSDSGERVFVEVPNQCIVIEVPITGATGNYVNFIKEVENKYGFDVAHPRQAEHRRRMADMAAAGAALESGAGSADEMALDGSDVDSNVDMGGMDDDSAGGETTKKKKSKRGDEYDKTDEFIDDTEQAWEERAMASQHGYFVWSGPLIQEADKPDTEKAAGPVKRARGGRGRGGSTRGESSGRGRGSGTKRGASSTSTRGSRGGAAAAARKARMTKADQQQREAEKAEREKAAVDLPKEPSIPAGIIGM